MKARLAFIFVLFTLLGRAQPVPSLEEKIPFICTFSKNSDKEWGDDDFVQTFFFVIPESYKRPVYIRVFDPDVGGMHDENHLTFDSRTKFTVYGGKGAHSEPDARGPDPVGNYKSGVELYSRVFGQSAKTDNNWVSLGPFNPAEGELQPEIGGRVLKVVIEGLEGDDGNLYKLFLSENVNENVAVEGGNGFAYEYTFRLSDKIGAVSHLYPFVAENVNAVKVKVFDYDDEGMIRIVSVARKGDVCALEEDRKWIESRHRVTKPEINTSLDVQFIKKKDVKNNNIVVFITNQFNETMAFYTSPIGGVPKYSFKIGVKLEDE
jgi:hypothetical protein